MFGELPEPLRELVLQSRNEPLGERIDRISAFFKGSRYLEEAAGEGRPPDPDPPARYDVFDCITFVEEVLSLALAPDPADAGRYRRMLRYNSEEMNYRDRHHFFEAEWIPRNIEKGLIRDITAETGAASVMVKDVSLRSWQRWKRRKRFAFDDARFPVGPLVMPYLDLETALGAVARIPQGALVVTMRVDAPHLPIVVSHVGIRVGTTVPMFRHATHMSSRKVRDDRLAWYVEHLHSYDWWPIAGIRVLLPLEQGPRLIADKGSTSPPPLK